MDKFKFENDKNALQDYSPDISWHVIRTYIQGMDIDSLLEPDDYDDIEEKQRQKTVSKKVFQAIYDKVWKWYLEIKQKNNYWDDQDLGRYILENNLAKPSFPGIFCDEAQDFTRVEMELLFRFSFYSNKDIQRQDISKIPFAFAGDEFQTLNPTGFRWEALKAGFTQKFLLSLSTGTKGAGTINLNYHFLENNYRSLPEIVRFCNTLQLFRAVRFNISGLRPQNYWKSQSSIPIPVASFHSDEAEFWEKIQKLTDTVFIIPCDEGQEAKWIENDKELSRYIKLENGAPLYMRVLSANQAKGLEFNHVVVYGFGSNCPPKMIESNDDEDISVTLPLEYYINKTYVAISRAKKRLFIVDTQEGMNNLWDVTINRKRVDGYIEKINERNTEKWSLDNDLSFLICDLFSLMENIEEINNEDNALQFRQKGISERSPYILRQAANTYRMIGKNLDADKWEATAYLFDKKYIQAGTKYVGSGFRSEAIKAFWLANSDEGYEKIVQKTEWKQDYKFMYSIALARIKKDKNVLVDAIKVVSEASKETLYTIFKGDEIFMDYDLRAILPDAVNKIVQEIKAHIDPSKDHFLLYQIIDISDREIKITPAYIAEIAYTLKEYERAVDYWNESDTKDNEKYNTAKAFTTKFPENLPLFKSIKRYDEIINQYSLNKEKKLSEDHLYIAAEAFLFQKDKENALHICTRLTSPGSFTQLAKCYATVGSDKAIQNIFYILARISEIREDDWNVIIKPIRLLLFILLRLLPDLIFFQLSKMISLKF